MAMALILLPLHGHALSLHGHALSLHGHALSLRGHSHNFNCRPAHKTRLLPCHAQEEPPQPPLERPPSPPLEEPTPYLEPKAEQKPDLFVPILVGASFGGYALIVLYDVFFGNGLCGLTIDCSASPW